MPNSYFTVCNAIISESWVADQGLLMRVLVLGSGMIGPAAAWAVANRRLTDSAPVDEVVIIDRDERALERARGEIQEQMPPTTRLETAKVDLLDHPAVDAWFHSSDIAIAALPRKIQALGVEAARRTGKPLVDVARPEPETLARWKADPREPASTVILGCGLDPGLTESLAVHLAEGLEAIERVWIGCGGIPERPAPPLGYRLVFGGGVIPLRADPAHGFIDGQWVERPRYGDVESLDFDPIGRVEAYDEGVTSWLPEHPAIRRARAITQKTIRWPGYAAAASLLRDCGLLETAPVQVGEVSISPKALLDAVLAPRLARQPDEADLVVLRVEVQGRDQHDRAISRRIDLFDRRDEQTGITAMARCTVLPAAFLVEKWRRGELASVGLSTLDQALDARGRTELFKALTQAGVTLRGDV